LGPADAAWPAGEDEPEAAEAGAVDALTAGSKLALGVLAAEVLAALLSCVVDEQAETATPRPTSEVPTTSAVRDDRPKFMMAPIHLTGTDTLGDSGPRYSVVPWR
jgi:hypothetical protein